MKIKRIVISILAVIMCLVIFNKVEAAGSVSLSASKTTANVGDTFTVSVNISGMSVATLTTRIDIDTQKLEYVSGPSNSNYSNGRVLYTWTDPTGGSSPLTGGTIAIFTFKAKAEGSAAISVSGNFYDSDENSINPSFSGTSITVKKVEQTPPVNNEGGTNTENSGNTGNAGNTGNTGGTGNTGSTGGTGNTGSTGNQNPSNNQGNTNNKSSNNNLQSLQLDVQGLSPAFNKNETQYYLTIQDDISNINVIAKPEDSKSKVNITGNTNIQMGVSKIRIIVTAENGANKEYIINVTKTANLDLANANLENLAIENCVLVPEFNEDVTEYTTEIYGDIDKLNILAVPKKETAKVQIEGNESLQYGENLIKIIVTAEDGQTNKLYNVLVNKLEETSEEEHENENYDEIHNSINGRVFENNKIIIFSLIIIAIFLITLTVIINKKKKMKQ